MPVTGDPPYVQLCWMTSIGGTLDFGTESRHILIVEVDKIATYAIDKI